MLDIASNRIKKIENVGHLTELQEFWVRSTADGAVSRLAPEPGGRQGFGGLGGHVGWGALGLGRRLALASPGVC